MPVHAGYTAAEYDDEYDDYYDEEEEEFEPGEAWLYIDDQNTLWVGYQFNVYYEAYSEGSKFDVTSSDESVISVKCKSGSGECTCTTLKAGQATITVTETNNGKTYTILERTITVTDEIFLNCRIQDSRIENSNMTAIKKSFTLVPVTGYTYIYLENYYNSLWEPTIDGDVKVSTDSKLLKVSTFSEKELKASKRNGNSRVIKLTGTGKGYGTAKIIVSYGGETKTISVYVTPVLTITAGMYTEITLCTKFKPDVNKFYIKSLKGITLDTAYRPEVKKRGNMWVSTICLDTKSSVKEGFYKIKVGYKGTKKTVYVDTYKKGKKNYNTSKTIWVLPYDEDCEFANE